MIIDFLAPSLILLLVLAGAAVGFVAGLVGIGGGVLFVPILLLLLPESITPEDERLPFIFGTTLMVSWLIAVASSSVHRKRLSGLGRDGIWLGAAAIIGAQGGAAAAANLPSPVLETVLALLLIGVAPLLIFVAKDKGGDKPMSGAEELAGSPKETSAVKLGLTGFLVGLISSTVGLGGALLSIPALIFILKYDSRRAMAVAPVMMSLTAASAVVGFMINGLGTPGLPPLSVGYVNLAIAAILAVAAIPLALAGARLAHKTGARPLRIILAILLAGVGAYLLYSSLQ